MIKSGAKITDKLLIGIRNFGGLMNWKNRVSIVTTLLLLFTLVLFYQNCSQESGSLFNDSENGQPEGASSISFRFFLVDPTNVNNQTEISIAQSTPTLDQFLAMQIENASSTTSVIGCVHVTGTTPNPCTQNNIFVGGVSYPQSGVPARVLQANEYDCKSVFNATESDKPIWQNIKCPYQQNISGMVEVAIGKFKDMDFLRKVTAPLEILPCTYPLQFTSYAKVNDGNKNNFSLAKNSVQITYMKPTRCF